MLDFATSVTGQGAIRTLCQVHTVVLLITCLARYVLYCSYSPSIPPPFPHADRELYHVCVDVSFSGFYIHCSLPAAINTLPSTVSRVGVC